MDRLRSPKTAPVVPAWVHWTSQDARPRRTGHRRRLVYHLATCIGMHVRFCETATLSRSAVPPVVLTHGHGQVINREL